MRKTFLLIIIMSILITGCGLKPKKTKEAPVKIVKTIVANYGGAGIQRNFPGIVESSSITDLSFDISGRLVTFPIKDGQKVHRGQLIAKLEPDTQNYKLNSAQANFLEAQADFNRNKQLYAQGVISAADYQARKRKYENAKSALNLAKKELNNTYLRAPFSGTITKKIAENHQYISAKEPIAVLQDLNDLEIEINVPENLMPYEKQVNQMKFKAIFESYPDEEFPISLKSKGQQADEITKTYPAQFYITDKKGAIILPGMTAKVFVDAVFENKSYIAIPVNSIFMDENGKEAVWIVKEDETATKSIVKVKEIRADKAIIISGINDNDRIIISGAHNILEGDKIKEYERLDLTE